MTITKVVYYDTNDWVYYGGMEYNFDEARISTADEFLNEFGVVLEELAEKVDNKEKYIVIKEEYRRVDESEGKEKEEYSFILTSRYWKAGVELELEGKISSETESFYAERVKVGESGERYRVYSMCSENHAKKVWDNVMQATVYIELLDYEGSEYLRKVRVMN